MEYISLLDIESRSPEGEKERVLLLQMLAVDSLPNP